MNTAWLFGGVDMNRWIDFKTGSPEQFTQFMARGREQMGACERPFVSWRNDVALYMGPRQSGFSALDVDDQTEVEIRSHRLMAAHLEYYRRHAPGFDLAARQRPLDARRSLEPADQTAHIRALRHVHRGE